MKFLMLILKNLRRNMLRSTLTSAGVMVLVFVITLIWSILGFLDTVTSEKTSNFKGIVTEKWSIPSQMPFSYADTLENGAAREDTDIKPIDSMTWQFFPRPRRCTLVGGCYWLCYLLCWKHLACLIDTFDQGCRCLF